MAPKWPLMIVSRGSILLRTANNKGTITQNIKMKVLILFPSQQASVCKVGQPHPTRICSNFGPVPFTCPDKYECVPNNVQGLFDAPGACCLKVETG